MSDREPLLRLDLNPDGSGSLHSEYPDGTGKYLATLNHYEASRFIREAQVTESGSSYTPARLAGRWLYDEGWDQVN